LSRPKDRFRWETTHEHHASVRRQNWAASF
jgi:hypothetical protein